MKYYTGIGSRKTPEDVLLAFTSLAMMLEERGLILRSGGADGADTAFEDGVKEESGKRIYLPWEGFNGSDSPLFNINPSAVEMAKRFHPAWSNCSYAAKCFHSRNCYQVLGEDLNTPSAFVVCWTPEGKVTGGTGQALRIAENYNIPIINFGNAKTNLDKAIKFIDMMVGNGILK